MLNFALRIFINFKLNDDDNFPAVNGINTDSKEIIKTSGIETPYNDKDNEVDVSVNDTTADSEAKTKTNSEDKGETHHSTELFNNEDGLVVNASVNETSSNFEELPKTSEPASLDNNTDFSATYPSFEGIASDSENAAEVSESASQDNDENILVKGVSQNGIGADSDEIPNTFESLEPNALMNFRNSSDEELVRPSKKIRLSKHEKLWDSDDENEDKAAIEEDMELDGDVEDDYKDNVNADEHEELDVDLEEENQSNVDSAEENESDEDVSESLKRKNISLKTSAELSGEEGSSDENEDDLDEFVADDIITNEVLTNEEKLRKEIGAIHFKRQQDEDDQVIRQLKNDFLPEGELYSENGSRKRKYVWNNIVADDEYTETKSDSEEEEVENIQPDYLKWQQEKNKADLPDIDCEKIEISKGIGLKVDILGKVSVTRCNTITSTKISLSPMQRRGSFLNSSIGMNSKFIKEFNDSPGAVTRKNFVFSALKQDNSLPSSPVTEVKNTKPTINNSIFNKI
ncbi:uncharacterized protein TNCT_113241 [Trichonephila clavata]|uniref:Uncharacterized protein n=1 Tax=Trichonephila clavata TaxID=2740835 RepID=A0A8X6GJ64_TRICU|nr:uncharacterized protein TNCT_113241 [Trichonephila clavata]